MKKKIIAGLVQQSNTRDKDRNIQKLSSNIRECAEKGAKLIVLQELHDTLYFCQTEDVENFDLAEEIPGKSTDIYGSLAKSHDIVLVTSIFEKRAPGIYHNTAVVFEKNGKIAGTYRKMHIPDDPAYYEKFYFTPGDSGFIPVNTSVGKLGVLVCWDQWYPEAARLMAMAGADILIYPTAIGFEKTDSIEEKENQFSAWRISQRAHAIANGIPVISVNRTGHEADPSNTTKGIDFWGGSFVAGPQGEIIMEAPRDSEKNLIVEIDLGRVEKVRQIWPFFRDRRIDAYQDICKRYLTD